MYHADNVEVNPFFLDSPAYCKRLQLICDRNYSVDLLFKAVKDKILERVTVPKMRSAEFQKKILKKLKKEI